MKKLWVIVSSLILLFSGVGIAENRYECGVAWVGHNFRVTAYSNDPISINVEKWRDGKTATGTTARWGIVAVDPKIIPLGSAIYILKLGEWFLAQDVGGAIKGKSIDIFYETREDALEWGIQYLTILVCENPILLDSHQNTNQ